MKPQNMLFVRNAAALGRQTSSYHRGQRSTSGDIRPTQSKKAILKMLGMNQIYILFNECLKDVSRVSINHLSFDYRSIG